LKTTPSHYFLTLFEDGTNADYASRDNSVHKQWRFFRLQTESNAEMHNKLSEKQPLPFGILVGSGTSSLYPMLFFVDYHAKTWIE
jgi:hypothetical protein